MSTFQKKMLLLLVLICRPESRFLELIPREESEDSESAVPRLILRRQNTPSDDSTPPKVNVVWNWFYNTVKPPLTATSVIRSPHCKNTHDNMATLLTRPNFGGASVTVLTRFHCMWFVCHCFDYSWICYKTHYASALKKKNYTEPQSSVPYIQGACYWGVRKKLTLP